MNNREKKGEEFLRKFPKFRKWIVECKMCHKRGYRLDLPSKITAVDGSLEMYFIKKYFDPLSLDENKICECCSKILKRVK